MLFNVLKFPKILLIPLYLLLLLRKVYLKQEKKKNQKKTSNPTDKRYKMCFKLMRRPKTKIYLQN